MREGEGDDCVFELEGSGFEVFGNERNVCGVPDSEIVNIEGEVCDFPEDSARDSFDRGPAGGGNV